MSSGTSPAALVGLAVDVSGSMKQRFRNRDGIDRSRFRTFQEALGRVVEASRQRAQELARSDGSGSAEALVFVYAFGLSVSPEVVDLLALLAAAEGVTTPAEIARLTQRHAAEIRDRYAGYGDLATLARSYGFGGVVDQYAARARASAEDEVRQKVSEEIMGRVRARLATNETVTLTLTELARRWWAGSGSFEHAEHFIFGRTPMRECLEAVADRFAAEGEQLAPDVHKLLILVSDGEPTDGDPGPALERIRSQGVFIASCLVVDADMTEPRRLYAEPGADWGKPARLMFEAASVLDDDAMYRELLEGRGWTVAERSRLFVQINQSDMMDEFLTAAFDRTHGRHGRG